MNQRFSNLNRVKGKISGKSQNHLDVLTPCPQLGTIEGEIEDLIMPTKTEPKQFVPKIPPEDWQEILRLHAEGVKTSAIARQFNLHSWRVANWLKWHNNPEEYQARREYSRRRYRGEKVTWSEAKAKVKEESEEAQKLKGKKQKIVELHRDGVPPRAIAIRLGLEIHEVYAVTIPGYQRSLI